jgi:hypothetical protein
VTRFFCKNIISHKTKHKTNIICPGGVA